MKRSLVFGVLIGLVALTAYASAHMMGYGMPGMMGYGMGDMYGEDMMNYYNTDEAQTEVSGKVVAVYPMAVVLEDGKYIRVPWWVAANLGLKPGDDVKAKGFSYGNVIVPTYIEANGKTFQSPVYYQNPGYGYYSGYHCPMMGW